MQSIVPESILTLYRWIKAHQHECWIEHNHTCLSNGTDAINVSAFVVVVSIDTKDVNGSWFGELFRVSNVTQARNVLGY